ncbi:tumor necrosis factor receptor superfamily member 11B-like [Leucoraja erinacea]|uniref:tumor necrosis factor receptor superfamily member 11B-like n=1 Tax=Leucoraja erinaceus TaxID=7782 RepID=UPI002453E9BE|nr:tumor necrosis factor receptor superfamily member 11B-like [Leucoraja erinacea]
MGYPEVCCILLLIFNLQLVTSCGSDEYNFQDLCCSMCQPGTRVLKHCTATLETMCISCTHGTYMDRSNGLEKCMKCKYCDAELGLETQRECSETQDTGCECKEGYFCLAKTKDKCHMCTKYITHFLNDSKTDKGDLKQQAAKPTAQSVLTQANVKPMEPDGTQNPLQPVNKTVRRKTIPKSETDKLLKWELAPETSAGKSKVARVQEPATIRKTLMTLIQSIDQTFPKESLKLQEAGNKVLTEFQNSVQTNLGNMQNVMQVGLADIQNSIQSSMAGLQGTIKTGMEEIKSALQTGMTGIQEALISGMTEVKGIKIGLTLTDNTLKQIQANSQSNLVLMTKQLGSLVNVLTKSPSNQTIPFIQFKDIICNKAETIEQTTKQP